MSRTGSCGKGRAYQSGETLKLPWRTPFPFPVDWNDEVLLFPAGESVQGQKDRRAPRLAHWPRSAEEFLTGDGRRSSVLQHPQHSMPGSAAKPVGGDMGLDPAYFSTSSWSQRVADWLARASGDPFLADNVRLVRQIMEHPESGLRMVVNISATALLSFLAAGRYLNLYERPVIGGSRKVPSRERSQVDSLLGFDNPSGYYFGAVALGGTGVRFYGEYCMVLKPDEVRPGTQILDRDSYDLLLPPLAAQANSTAIVDMLRGRWGADAIDMLTLKLLPELQGTNRLITTGTVSEMILYDQDFVEIHKRGNFNPSSLEEVRQSPDEIAMEARVQARASAGFASTAVELLWLKRRDDIIRALEREGIQCRIVTLHGRGYQWR